jgi:methylmalonyl-CoA/ethylmalonyl-CoA epimerase
MNIDHIGIVVKSLEEGIKHWRKIFGYEQITEIIPNTRQKVKVVFLSKENSIPVKLMEPTDLDSPVFMFAKRGGGLHHLCFKCDDVGEEVDRLKSLGLRTLVEPQPGEAVENGNIAFVYAKQGITIELIDSDKLAKRIE